MPAFEWNEQRTEAAQLLANGRLSDSDIAEKLGIDRTTLWRWLQREEFAARVAELVENQRREIERIGIAQRHQRLAGYNDRRTRLLRVIEARADDPQIVEGAGGGTGLLVRRKKKIGQGDASETVIEYAVDTGLLGALLDLEKQAAIETGQWTEKREHTGKGGGPIVVKVLKNVSLDDL